MTKLSFQDKYKVIGNQDSSYEGIFVTGVKTTGIFCRPSCRARKPKPENVIYILGFKVESDVVIFIPREDDKFKDFLQHFSVCDEYQNLQLSNISHRDMIDNLLS